MRLPTKLQHFGPFTAALLHMWEVKVNLPCQPAGDPYSHFADDHGKDASSDVDIVEGSER